jgi:hypothetical protein
VPNRALFLQPLLFSLAWLACARAAHTQTPRRSGALAVLALAAFLPGQCACSTSTAARAAAHPPSEWTAAFASEDPRDLAWAAHRAREERRTDALPALMAAVRRVCIPQRRDGSFRMHAALTDALIQLDARVEPRDLEALAKLRHVHAQVLVLAAREPRRHAALLERMCDLSDENQRLAAWNLLALAAPARAAELALGAARIEIEVEVRDEGQDFEPRRGGTHTIACPKQQPLDGYPPAVVYVLEEATDAARDVVAPGPIPILANRTGWPTGREWDDPSKHPSSDYALRLLPWLAGDPARKSELPSFVRIRHAWTTPDEFVRECSGEIAAVQQEWRACVERLAAALPIDAAWSTRRAPIDFHVRDERRDPARPLPMLAASRP